MNEASCEVAYPQDMARGFMEITGGWQCLLCNARFEDGCVYEIGGRLYEARRAIREHMPAAHGPVFSHLLEQYAQLAGLTERQAEALALMASGLGDRAVAAKLSGADNTASLRNLRHQLKEREKQAKAFLAIMEAFRTERAAKAEANVPDMPIVVHAGATLADERFEVTEKEREAVLKACFSADGSLRDFPVREKRKVVVLAEIARRFEKDRVYTEKEVNELVAWRDFATVRRYLVEYGFLERSPDCSRYWVKEGKKNGASGELPE